MDDAVMSFLLLDEQHGCKINHSQLQTTSYHTTLSSKSSVENLTQLQNGNIVLVGNEFGSDRTSGLAHYPDLYCLNEREQSVNSFSPMNKMPCLIKLDGTCLNGVTVNGNGSSDASSMCSSSEVSLAVNVNNSLSDSVMVQLPLWALNPANLNSLGLGDSSIATSPSKDSAASLAKVELVPSAIIKPKSTLLNGNGERGQQVSAGLKCASQQYQQLIEVRRHQQQERVASDQHQLSYPLAGSQLRPSAPCSTLTKPRLTQTSLPPAERLSIQSQQQRVHVQSASLASQQVSRDHRMPPLLPLNAATNGDEAPNGHLSLSQVQADKSKLPLVNSSHASLQNRQQYQVNSPLTPTHLGNGQPVGQLPTANTVNRPSSQVNASVSSHCFQNGTLPSLSTFLSNDFHAPSNADIVHINNNSNSSVTGEMFLQPAQTTQYAVYSVEFANQSPDVIEVLRANGVSFSDVPSTLNSQPGIVSNGAPLLVAFTEMGDTCTSSQYGSTYSSVMAPSAMQLASEYGAATTMTLPPLVSSDIINAAYAYANSEMTDDLMPLGAGPSELQWLMEVEPNVGNTWSNVPAMLFTTPAGAVASLGDAVPYASSATALPLPAAAAAYTLPSPHLPQHACRAQGDVYNIMYQGSNKVVSAVWNGKNFVARPNVNSTADKNDQGQVRGQGQEGYSSRVHASEGILVAEGQGYDREKGRQGQVVGGGNKDGKMKSNESSMKRLSLAAANKVSSAISSGGASGNATDVTASDTTTATSSTASGTTDVASKPKALLLPKMTDGQYAVCGSCGGLSADYKTCENCRRPLPPAPKLYNASLSSSSSSISLSSSTSSVASLSVAVTTTTTATASAGSLSPTIPRQLSRPTIRRPASAALPQVKVKATPAAAVAADMVTVLSSDEEDTAEDGYSSDGSEQQACKRCRLSPDLFATATSTATSPRHSSTSKSPAPVYEIMGDEENKVVECDNAAGDRDSNSPERSRSPTPVRSFSKPVVKLFTYPPPPATGGIAVTNEDLYCLRQGEFLNDVIIDFYLRFLHAEELSETEQRVTHIFSSFFYRRLTQRSSRHDEQVLPLRARRYNRVKNWTKNVDLFSKDFIIIPVNESAHWYLAIICYPYLVGREASSDVMEASDASSSDSASDGVTASSNDCVRSPCILIFDSLSGPQRNSTVKILKDYLQEEWNARKAATEGSREFSADVMRGVCPRCPQQNNYSDCGVYVLQYVESFFKNPIKDFAKGYRRLESWFSDATVLGKRHDIARLICNLQRILNPSLAYDPRAEGCVDFPPVVTSNQSVPVMPLDESDDSVVLTLPTS